MISLNQIQRLVRSRAFARLAERILANGCCHSRLARQRLARSGDAAAVEAAAIGLALRRCSELTYGPCDLAAELAERLVRLQRPDGLFGAGDGCIAVTAAALRGLMQWMNRGDADDAGVSEAVERGLAGLRERLVGAGHGTSGGDAVGSAIVLWQLGDCPRFRAHLGEVHCRRLMQAVMSLSRGRIGDDLTRYAYAMAA